MIARLGVIAPEEIMVAMMVLTSCRPLVNAKVTMQRSVNRTMRVASVMMKIHNKHIIHCRGKENAEDNQTQKILYNSL